MSNKYVNSVLHQIEKCCTHQFNTVQEICFVIIFFLIISSKLP